MLRCVQVSLIFALALVTSARAQPASPASRPAADQEDPPPALGTLLEFAPTFGVRAFF